LEGGQGPQVRMSGGGQGREETPQAWYMLRAVFDFGKFG
jgi:hypothetical protein